MAMGDGAVTKTCVYEGEYEESSWPTCQWNIIYPQSLKRFYTFMKHTQTISNAGFQSWSGFLSLYADCYCEFKLFYFIYLEFYIPELKEKPLILLWTTVRIQNTEA